MEVRLDLGTAVVECVVVLWCRISLSEGEWKRFDLLLQLKKWLLDLAIYRLPMKTYFFGNEVRHEEFSF